MGLLLQLEYFSYFLGELIQNICGRKDRLLARENQEGYSLHGIALLKSDSIVAHKKPSLNIPFRHLVLKYILSFQVYKVSHDLLPLL